MRGGVAIRFFLAYNLPESSQYLPHPSRWNAHRQHTTNACRPTSESNRPIADCSQATTQQTAAGLYAISCSYVTPLNLD